MSDMDSTPIHEEEAIKPQPEPVAFEKFCASTDECRLKGLTPPPFKDGQTTTEPMKTQDLSKSFGDACDQKSIASLALNREPSTSAPQACT